MGSKSHGLLPFKGLEHLCASSHFRPGRFARLFKDLPPLYVDPRILKEVGRAGGPMEDKGPQELTHKVPAGLIFFGQFIDHDITFDDSTSLTSNNDPLTTENVRTPTLDLDCVYGDGPEAHPFLFNGAGKLLTGVEYADPNKPNDLKRDDLPRTPAPFARAIIGDPRNDENRAVSQLQLGFLRFHNRVVDELAGRPNPPDEGHLFEEARRIATWHYQWIIINEFLPAICGQWVVDDILANGRKVYRPEDMGIHEPFIPIEFSTAAYRFGHTMIPQKFRVQPGGPEHDLFGGTLGHGFQPVMSPAEVVDWAALLDTGNGNTFSCAGKADTLMAKALLALPTEVVGNGEASLAVRNLLRAQSFRIPSGEQVANAMISMGVFPLTQAMIQQVRTAGKNLGLPTATPLWLYILAEGKEIGRLDGFTSNGKPDFSKGDGLGPVGARLVAEVLIGLLELDDRSFLGANRNWSPFDAEDQIGTGITRLYELLTP